MSRRTEKKAPSKVTKFSVEVDLSGRIEDTSCVSVLAYSNGKFRTVLIAAKVKREAIKTLRYLGKAGKVFYIQLYTAGLCLLLKPDLDKISTITIDEEYRNKGKDVKVFLAQFLSKNKSSYDLSRIHFKQIGRLSPAHFLAINCLRKKVKPSASVKTDELLRLILSTKDLAKIKKDRGLPSGN